MELSSISGSYEDYRPSSSTEHELHPLDLSKEMELSSISGSYEDYRPSSSTEHELHPLDLSKEMELSSISGSYEDYRPSSSTEHELHPLDLSKDMESSSISGSYEDYRPSSSTKHELHPLDMSKEMELSSISGSYEDYRPSSSTEHEVHPLDLSKEMELSSISGSYEDYRPISSTEHEVHPLDLSKEMELSSISGSYEDYHPSSTPSSSEHEVLEAEDQETKAKSNQLTEQLKGRMKLQGDKKRQQVTIKMSKNGRKAWDKVHYCLYCKTSNLRMSRHLQKEHSDETDVAYAFSFPLGSKQRKTLLESLRNKGDWQHNLKVLEEGNGEIVTWKQPSKKLSVTDYLPCPHCYAMFKRTVLWRHEKSCRQRKGEREESKGRRVQEVSSQLLPIKESSEQIQKLIHSMMQDKVTSHIRSDEMICTYGDALSARKGREQSQHRYIARKMRQLGRLVLAAKEIDKRVIGLKDMCDPAHFQLAIKAARMVSDYSPSTRKYGKPSTAVKIGYTLRRATEAWIAHCLMMSDVLTEKKAKKFKELLDNSWSSYMSANAHSTMEHGAVSLKGRTLNTLDSVVFGKGHEATSTKGSRGVTEGGPSHADRQLEANDDGEVQQKTARRPPVERRKKTATKRHDDDDHHDGDDGDDDEDGSDDDGDGKERPMNTIKAPVKRQKTATKWKYDDDDWDEEE